MWLAALTQIMALAVTAPTAAAPSAPATATPSGVVYTRQMLFAIPFHIDRPESILQEPVEVRLYVSADQGAHWDYYAKAEPSRQQFMFRVDRDGQYWFQARTLDRSGTLRPKTLAPGLKVIVDTTPPKVQLQARPGDGGQVTVHWQIDELNLKPDSLTIQFRTAATAPWQPVAIDRQNLTATGSSQIGEVTFVPPRDVRNLEIRADVSDMAGNPAVTRIPLHLNIAPPASAVAATPTGRPYGETLGRNVLRDPPPAPSTNALAAATTPAAAPPAEGNAWRAAHEEPPPVNWPAGNATAVGSGNTALAAASDHPLAAHNAAATANASPPTMVAIADAGARGPATGGAVTAAVQPPVANQVPPPAPPNNGPGPAATATLPTGPILATLPVGERPRMVNSRVFALEYDIDAVGPSGVGRVELWGTRDGGRTWRSFGVDEKKHSPMLVSVDREGLFGFRVVASSGAGVTGRPPQSGDHPEVWIGVDLTRPVGHITSVAPGSGPERDKLVITWEASDQMLLAARPITLALAENRNGPWHMIATDLENTGRFAWATDSRLPLRAFLQLRIRDEAGNVGQYETSEPVSLDHSNPVARIRDVRPMPPDLPPSPLR